MTPLVGKLLGILFLLTGSAALADPIEFQGVSGKLSSQSHLYSQRLRGWQSYQQRADAELEGSLSDGTHTLKFVPWLWWRMPEATGGAPRPNRFFFEAKEAWLERASANWELRIGNQILSWGAADQINPTDNWNPRDLYDPLVAPKLPLPVVKLKAHPESTEWLNVELIFTPVFRESRLPVTLPGSTTGFRLTDSRWLVPIPSNVTASGLSVPLNFEITKPSYPTTWQAGTRVQFLRLGGWDFSTSYYDGVESLPRFGFNRRGQATSSALPVNITLLPSFHRQRVFGADGSGSFSVLENDFGARFELAYFDRDNSQADAETFRDNYVHGVWGIDHTLKKQVFGTVLYANLQYIYYRRLENREATPGLNALEGLPTALPFDSNFALYVEDRIGSSLKLTGFGLYSLQNGDALLTPAVEYGFTDNIKAKLSADFFVGPERGFFGQFRENRRSALNLNYVF